MAVPDARIGATVPGQLGAVDQPDIKTNEVDIGGHMFVCVGSGGRSTDEDQWLADDEPNCIASDRERSGE